MLILQVEVTTPSHHVIEKSTTAQLHFFFQQRKGSEKLRDLSKGHRLVNKPRSQPGRLPSSWALTAASSHFASVSDGVGKMSTECFSGPAGTWWHTSPSNLQLTQSVLEALSFNPGGLFHLSQVACPLSCCYLLNSLLYKKSLVFLCVPRRVVEKLWARDVGRRMTFNSRAVATFPESAGLPWCLHGDQSISFIISSTLAGKAKARIGRVRWMSGWGWRPLWLWSLSNSTAEGPLWLWSTPFHGDWVQIAAVQWSNFVIFGKMTVSRPHFSHL